MVLLPSYPQEKILDYSLLAVRVPLNAVNQSSRFRHPTCLCPSLSVDSQPAQNGALFTLVRPCTRANGLHLLALHLWPHLLSILGTPNCRSECGASSE